MNAKAAEKINTRWHGMPQKGRGDEFNAHIEDIDLPALVQLACMERGDRVLIASGEGMEGEIFFSNGEIIHATYNGLKGEDAFFRLVCEGPRSFWLNKSQSPEKTIHTPWNFLLLEALRRKDEALSRVTVSGDVSLKMLVVDKPSAFRVKLEDILREECGTEVILTANNIRDALEKLSSFRPSLILLDIDMPESGKDLAIKHIMIKSPAPVVLFGSLNPAVFTRAAEFLRLGAIDFIPKPGNDMEWLHVSDRLEKIARSLNGLAIANIRRARRSKGDSKKTRPGPPAARLLIIIGGIGGLVELQKILPALPSGGYLSVVVFQDMANEAAALFANAMDRMTDITVSHLRAGGPLLGSQCWFSSWDGSWEIISDGSGAAVRQVEGALSASLSQSSGFDAIHLIKTASISFGPNLSILVLSGADIDLKTGLDDAVSHGCHVWLQTPESAIYPGPLDDIRSWEFEEACIEVEDAGRLVHKWCMGEALWQDF